MARDPLVLARSIGERFVAWQAASGRPASKRCPFAMGEARNDAGCSSAAAALARALYLLYERGGATHYKIAADRYAIFALASPRDPVEPFDDFRRVVWLRDSSHQPPARSSTAVYYGGALSAYAAFGEHNPEEHAFSARADAVFEWLQRRRIDRDHAYDLGDVGVTDRASVDDLSLVGAGLMAYYRATRRQEALDAALRLGDYFLRGPWQPSRGVVELLTRVHKRLPADHPRAALMRDRCRRCVRWQFGCQFANGAVGMHAQDDEWLGMTAAAILAYDDIRRAGWVDDGLAAELDPLALLSSRWLVENTTEELVDAGGYRRITGRSRLGSPDHTLRLLAWTVEALLRLPTSAQRA